MDRLGDSGADVRACIWFRQNHGAAPAALYRRLDEPLDLFGGPFLPENARHHSARDVEVDTGVGSDQQLLDRPVE